MHKLKWRTTFTTAGWGGRQTETESQPLESDAYQGFLITHSIYLLHF